MAKLRQALEPLELFGVEAAGSAAPESARIGHVRPIPPQTRFESVYTPGGARAVRLLRPAVAVVSYMRNGRLPE